MSQGWQTVRIDTMYVSYLQYETKFIHVINEVHFKQYKVSLFITGTRSIGRS